MLENQCTSGKFLVSIVGMATEAQSALQAVRAMCAGVGQPASTRRRSRRDHARLRATGRL